MEITNSFVASFTDPITGDRIESVRCYVAEIEVRRGWTVVNDVLSETVCAIAYRVGYIVGDKKRIYTTPTGPFLKLPLDGVKSYELVDLIPKCVEAFKHAVELSVLDVNPGGIVSISQGGMSW